MSADSPFVDHARRDFLTTSASGLGAIGLGAMLSQDGVLGPRSVLADDAAAAVNPLAPKAPHFAPKAKSCIFIFMAGAPSHLDLFDPKPKLNEMNGQKLPESMTKNVRFAFIKKDSAKLMGTNRTFKKYGECGTEFSDLLPNIGSKADDILLVRSMHTDQFNHHPGQLLMQCGRAAFGLPCMGSWLTYGLGSESQNLPGYVVLTAGRGSSGGATLWQSGFLPSVYSGVRFRNAGDPVLNLGNPDGLPPELQRAGLDALREVNQSRYATMRDPEIASRIASYELAFRMQSAAPELIDLDGETKSTLDKYGVNREDLKVKASRGGGPGQYGIFARNCLLARRMVERGVRFVNIVHASWDHHSNLDNELKYNAGMADQPIAALIQDLKDRGMLDETLVVWAGEFGRTPLGENRNGNPNATGRDHHPFAFSMFLAGGGIKGGQVYGETDEIGWAPTKDPVHVNDLQATMLNLFGLDHLKLTYRFQGRDFRLTDVAGNVLDRWIA
ncbi:DUF1501 domain-containing protein [Thalassoroseus pseudoceratinae]|uniref:DUF1501 domain-containing protein n=1 Tax=Thalassoroseus pseudoceratinae TaxID=2713176 RepID=UPI0014202A94|nr:DUF1501 domain-containing protein [Thalassoroseus pseudoceratinae]